MITSSFSSSFSFSFSCSFSCSFSSPSALSFSSSTAGGISIHLIDMIKFFWTKKKEKGKKKEINKLLPSSNSQCEGLLVILI